MRKIWNVSPVDKPGCENLRKALNISPLLAHLLLKRGVSCADDAREFLSGSVSSLHSPFLFKDMEKAILRILSAISRKESILIYGDYDVDGLTAAALLFMALKKRGANVSCHIPDRITEGYGLNIKVLKDASGNGVNLVIAVDCGVTATEEVAFLKGCGIDCVILDHHQPLKGPLPPAFAIIDPLISGCEYPYKSLASVGLVFKLIQALRYKADGGSDTEISGIEEELDFVALGTISDVAPLTGENRILVKRGLKHLAATKKKGLRALIKVSGIDKKKEFYSETVGFMLGPRINASGRVGSSLQSLKLLLTEDETEADSLAKALDSNNRERQGMEEVILKEAISKVEREVNFKDHKVIVVSSEKWHPGVIGIVASRIAERFYRPTILVAFSEEIGKGSGRSIKNFHLFEALSKCGDHLVGYGGHEYAAGITISKDNIDVFRERFNSVANEVLQPSDLMPRLEIDAEISLEELTPGFLKELSLLEPFGVGNRKPVFAVKNLSLKAKPKPVSSGALKIWVTDGRFTYEAVGFKRVLDFRFDSAPANFSLAFSPSINNWQGQEIVQLQLKDIQF
ncbi:MAG: single-stranded-DNA-specific exonuclease RecJ [Candidatus Omnitrophota bacterium]